MQLRETYRNIKIYSAFSPHLQAACTLKVSRGQCPLLIADKDILYQLHFNDLAGKGFPTVLGTKMGLGTEVLIAKLGPNLQSVLLANKAKIEPGSVYSLIT